jgi:DNA-binding GntR family transcriptional regulator
MIAANDPNLRAATAARLSEFGRRAMPIEPVGQGDLSARAYAALKDALIGGSFRPGQRLLMQDLAERLGTSVAPVRDACMKLVGERALEARSDRFVTVPDLTLSRYMEIRTIRIELEGLAAELAAQQSGGTALDAIADVQARFEAVDRALAPNDAMRLNREFHFMVYRLSGIEMLISHIESLWISMGPILNIFYNDIPPKHAGAEEHARVIEALRAGNGKKARAAIRMDILRAGEGLIAYLDQRTAGASG